MARTFGTRRRWRFAAAGMMTGVLALSACGGTSSGAAELNWYIYNPSASVFADAAASCSAASGGAYQVNVRYLPSDADGQRQQLVRRLAAADSSLDILGLDVTWTPEFAEAGWITPWPQAQADQVRNGTLQTSLDTGTYQNQLYGAPFNTNTQLLWYRKDLVPTPPTTWDEMIAAAERLAQQGKPHLIEIQGAQYEGLTAWFNTMVSSAGGQILNEAGTASALGPPALTALQTMQKFATSVAADPSLSNQKEDDNRLAFESGTAAFELNYPFVYPSAKKNAPDIFQNLGFAVFPRVVPDKPSKVTIGGIDLAVSKYSKHPQEAFEAIQCLRSRDKQIANAVDAGLPPTLTDIYQNPPANFVDSYPFYQEIFTSLQGASVRPKTPAYQSLSILIARVLSPPGGISPQADIDALQGSIADALQSKGLIP